MTRELAAVDQCTETEALKKIEGQLAKSPRRVAKGAEGESDAEGDDLQEEAA
jgi:CarD family transcriptional regulator